MQCMMTSGYRFFVYSNCYETIAFVGHVIIISFHMPPLSPLLITFTSVTPLYIAIGSQRTMNPYEKLQYHEVLHVSTLISTCSITNVLYVF